MNNVTGVQDIGKLTYLWTIFAGKNRQFNEFEDPNLWSGLENLAEKGLVPESNTIPGDIVITFGKNAVIVTFSAPWLLDGKRVPIVVKRWREVEENVSSLERQFVDTDNNKWTYYDSGNILEYRDSNGNLIYKFK